MLWDALTVRMLLYTVVSGLQTVVLGVMTLRHQYREFPVFYAYTAAVVFRSAALYWILYLYTLGRVSYAGYFYPYWITEPVTLLLCFAVVYRIFHEVFAGHRRVQQVGRLLFSVALLVLLTAAVVIIIASPDRESDRVSVAVMLLQRSIAVIRCGLLLMLFGASSYLGLSWRSQTLGIALGLGIWSVTDLTTIAVRTYIGPTANMGVVWATAIGYMLAVLIWLAYFLAPPVMPKLVDAVSHENVDRWNAALTELLNR